MSTPQPESNPVPQLVLPPPTKPTEVPVVTKDETTAATPPPAKPPVVISAPPQPVKTLPSSEIVLDWDSARAHLAKVEAEVVEKFAGKDGCNPYVWIAEKVRPLKDKLATGVRTPELFNDIMSLVVKEPRVDMNSTRAGLATD